MSSRASFSAVRSGSSQEPTSRQLLLGAGQRHVEDAQLLRGGGTGCLQADGLPGGGGKPGRARRVPQLDPQAQLGVEQHLGRWSETKLRPQPATMHTGNSSPLDLWMLITVTASLSWGESSAACKSEPLSRSLSKNRTNPDTPW